MSSKHKPPSKSESSTASFLPGLHSGSLHQTKSIRPILPCSRRPEASEPALMKSNQLIVVTGIPPPPPPPSPPATSPFTGHHHGSSGSGPAAPQSRVEPRRRVNTPVITPILHCLPGYPPVSRPTEMPFLELLRTKTNFSFVSLSLVDTRFRMTSSRIKHASSTHQRSPLKVKHVVYETNDEKL